MKLEDFKDSIIELLEKKFTIKQIEAELKQNYGEIRGLSSRSIRRFINEHNLNNKVSNEVLEDLVQNALNEVNL
jgi:hypothetical protein